MENSRSFLPNVDRANSTLFKRYLEEQCKSIRKSNIENEQLGKVPRKIPQATVVVKRKSVSAKKSLIEQKSSHTNRFMRRFQKHFKHGGETKHHRQFDKRKENFLDEEKGKDFFFD